MANLRHGGETALYQISESARREPPPAGEDLIIANTINSLIVFFFVLFQTVLIYWCLTADWLVGGDSSHFISDI